MKTATKDDRPLSSEQLVNLYFRCIDNKDVDGILDLFDYDAVVHEPFSNIVGGLRGRSSIEPFMRIAMMANDRLRRTIKLEKSNKSRDDTLVALITFEKGDKLKSKFTFEFGNDDEGKKKIRSLNIEFL